MENLFEDEKHLDALLRDVKQAILNKQYEFTDGGVAISCGIQLFAGGVFDINAARHEAVIKAMEDGDKEREAWLRAQILSGQIKPGYVDIDCARTHNLMPTQGRNFMLASLVGSVAKKSPWYPSAFKNNYTPGATWDANWAGASSGIGVTEIGTDDLAAAHSVRATATFGAAANGSIAMSAAVTYTVETATSIDVYGGTLNSNSTFGYDVTYASGGHVLLAATKRTTPVQGLATADLINISYTLTATST